MTGGRSGLVALLVALAGCAANPVHEGAFRPALFPAAAAAVAEPAPAGRVALLMPTAVADTVYVGEKLLGYPGDRRQVQVPIGRIVEQAALTALRRALAGPVEQVARIPTAMAEGFSLTLVVDAVRFAYHEQVKFVIPLILPGMLGDLIFITEVETGLAIDVRLLDGQGQVLATRTYDAGRQVWAAPPDTFELSGDGVVRLAHEAAWRLADQAAHDLVAWLGEQRNRPRKL